MTWIRIRKDVHPPNQHIANQPGDVLAMKFGHCAGAGQFPASLVNPLNFLQVGHPQSGRQVDLDFPLNQLGLGYFCSLPSFKDLARKREAAKAEGKAHDPNLGKLEKNDGLMH